MGSCYIGLRGWFEDRDTQGGIVINEPFVFEPEDYRACAVFLCVVSYFAVQDDKWGIIREYFRSCWHVEH